MALVRPKSSSGDKVNFYGVCEIALLNVTDKSDQFGWADIYLDVEIKQKGSDYTKSLRICGSFEKDPDGTVSGGSVLNRLYNFLDCIGCKAGINAKGGWEQEDGQAIDNIAQFLTQGYCGSSEPTSFPYLAYVYKEKPKKQGDKIYARVHHKIYPNEEANIKKLLDDVNWLKTRGYLKEASPEDLDAVRPVTSNGMDMGDPTRGLPADAFDNL